MRIRVLGCSGGIGQGFYTSSYLLDTNILIDAGTGVGNLNIKEMHQIDHVFVTHAHLDHIACLPLMADTTITHRTTPITIWGSETTISILQKHIFNNAVWPDFSVIPTPQNPFVQYAVIEPYTTVQIGHIEIVGIPVEHTIPTLAYHLRSDLGSYVICGDTYIQDTLWEYLNQLDDLRGLAIEIAFNDQEVRLSAMAKHLCPSLLVSELEKLKHDVPIHIMHLKPGQSIMIMEQLHRQADPRRQIDVLFNNQIIDIMNIDGEHG